jgi:hypothetical protein
MVERFDANETILVRHRLLAKGIGGGVQTGDVAVW